MSTYDAQSIERHCLEQWRKYPTFKTLNRPSAPTYSIPLPPPNVTGTLHMGHAFQQTLMDLLIRFHRIRGFNVHWQAGTDHAGIATQLVVEREIRKQGLDPHQLSQNDFLKYAVLWKESSSQTITQQMLRLGLYLDLEASRFTMDDGYQLAVTEAFVKLHADGLITRGIRLVNWNTVLQTAISDVEVVHKSEPGIFYYFSYEAEDQSGDRLTVATTRPETLWGDVALALHPDDPRAHHWAGRSVMIPLSGRVIPVITHPCVDMNLGSGVLKITPAHDFLDEKIGRQAQLPFIELLDSQGLFLKEAKVYDPQGENLTSLHVPLPERYWGCSVMQVRAQVVEALEQGDHQLRKEKISLYVPYCERTQVKIEPRLSAQWFLRTQSLAKRAKDHVAQGEIVFYPKHYEKLFFAWMNNLEDWCISRQLRWGHPIPVWWNQDRTQYYVGHTLEAVRAQHQLDAEVELMRDGDVLDTWFSSALWSFASLGWPEETAQLKAFHPTQVVVSAFDILYYWIARMVMLTSHLCGTVPFRSVVITGLVKDEMGEKMSKSKGNVIDPIDLIEGISFEALVEKRLKDTRLEQDRALVYAKTRDHFEHGFEAHGADALRLTLISLFQQSREVHWSHTRLSGYRNFCNKLWHAAKLLEKWREIYEPLSPSESLPPCPITSWSENKFYLALGLYEDHVRDQRFDLALQTLYDFTWHHFCDWHLEMVKPLAQKGQGRAGVYHTIQLFRSLLLAWHPMIPFLTEHLWQSFKTSANPGDPWQSIITHTFETKLLHSTTPLTCMLYDEIQALVTHVRSLGRLSSRRLCFFWGEKFKSVAGNALQPLLAHLLKVEILDANETSDLDLQQAQILWKRDDLTVMALYDGALLRATYLEQSHLLDRKISSLMAQIDQWRSDLSRNDFVQRAPAAIVEERRARLQRAQEALTRLQSDRQILQASIISCES